MLAGYGASKLDSVDEVNIRTSGRGRRIRLFRKNDPRRSDYEPGHFRKRRIQNCRTSFTRRERCRLPSPVDEVDGVYSIHSELATLPFTIKGVKTVTFRVGFSPSLIQKVNVLLELGLLSKKSVSIGKAKISPKDFLYTHLTTLTAPPSLDEFKSLQVEVIGKKNGESKKLILKPLSNRQENGNCGRRPSGRECPRPLRRTCSLAVRFH